jgi:small GTP-binding protein
MNDKDNKINELFNNIVESIDDVKAIGIFNEKNVLQACKVRNNLFNAGNWNDFVKKACEQVQKVDSYAFKNVIFEEGEYKVIYTETGRGNNLLTIVNKISNIGSLFSYIYLIVEKIVRIIDGKSVTLSIPDFYEENTTILKQSKIYEIGIEEGHFHMKVILGGDSGVGKTTLVTQFIENQFNPNFKTTIGVNILKKTLHYDKFNTDIEFMIYDAAGQQVFEKVRQTYFLNASAGFLVFDVTNPDSFKSIESWYREVKKASPECLLILVGNKIDMVGERRVSSDVAKNLAKKYKMKYIETSALNHDIVEESFMTLGFSFVIQARMMKIISEK